MLNLDINYEASLKNKKEQDFCKAVIDALQKSSTTANKLTFARKTKSYGSTSVGYFRATKSRDRKTREIWVNLGKLSNTGITKRLGTQFNPDFTAIPKIVDYAESDRLKNWFNK